jgi:hypothetical protein
LNEAESKFMKSTNVFKSHLIAAMPAWHIVRKITSHATVAVTLILSGCAVTGPHRLLVDRFDYSAAIASSTNEQMLLNLVRLCNNETPVFLDVNSVIAQYQVDAHAQIGLELGFSAAPGDTLTTSGVGAGWMERPTITYAPRSGPKFIRSLLTSLPPVAIFALVQGNWPVEDVVWGVVKSINGVGPRSPSTGKWNPDYQRMLDALSQVQLARALGFGRGDESQRNSILRFSVTGVDERTKKAIATLREIWDLDPGTNEYSVVLQVIPRNRKEIAVLTSSMLDLMRDVAALMEVPAEHVVQGQTSPTFKLPPEAPYGGRAPIRVQLSRERPGDAFVTVRKEGWWYSIAENDQQSKRVLLVLNVLFQLAESGEYPAGPVVTVPAGG